MYSGDIWMEDCSWVALVIFAFIVLFMMWLHANYISPWLVSYFRDQQLTELQERIRTQQAAADALQAQIDLQARQDALAAQQAAEAARREALAKQQQAARKTAVKQVANKVDAAVSKEVKLIANTVKQDAAKAGAAIKGEGQKATKAVAKGFTNLAKKLKIKK